MFQEIAPLLSSSVPALVSLTKDIASFVFVLLVIVFVHELGHFLVARWNGIAISTFSIGFGKELFGWNDKKGTRWRISAIPLGGYVKFVGDINPASMPDDAALERYSDEERASLFFFKNVWQRIAVVAAGPIANFILTFVILFGLTLGYGKLVIPPTIDDIVIGSPAEAAGLLPGDRIIGVDSYKIRSFGDFQKLVSTSPNHEISLKVTRLDETLTILITPVPAEIDDGLGNKIKVGRIGVSRTTNREDIEIFRPSIFESAVIAVQEIRFLIDRTFLFIGDMFVGKGDTSQLGGPVKVYDIVSDVSAQGFVPLINLIALLSISIGLFNLFPIPLLDGGYLLYYLIEVITGKPLSKPLQEFGFKIGLALVASIFIFTLVNDIFLT